MAGAGFAAKKWLRITRPWLPLRLPMNRCPGTWLVDRRRLVGLRVAAQFKAGWAARAARCGPRELLRRSDEEVRAQLRQVDQGVGGVVHAVDKEQGADLVHRDRDLRDRQHGAEQLNTITTAG